MPISQIIKPSVELLGTLNTTSGASHTLSGLDLTNFKQLIIAVKSVTFSAAAALTVGGVATTSAAVGNARHGVMLLDLLSGVLSRNIYTTGAAVGDYAIITPYSNATASLVFAGGTFTDGQIIIYGVR